MNRIATRQSEIALDLESRITLDFDQDATSRTPPRSATYIPLHYESGYAYPLIVWLPGRGETENVLAEVMPKVSLRNYLGISLRGPLTGARDQGLSWDLSLDGALDAAEAIEGCVTAMCRRFNVAPHRVFIAGHADGGTLATQIALASPGVFAGAASLGGALPRGDAPLSGLNQKRDLEVLLAQGRDADGYTEDDVCDDLRLLHYAGINVTLRQYPHGDELSDLMLADLNRWAMQLVTGHVESTPRPQPHEVN
ncbi:MAG: hypothetical protein AAGF97_11565 [Planctomycetota bacterium]